MSEIQIPVVNASNLYINGLMCAYNTNNKLTVTSGRARNSTDVTDIILQEDVVISTLVLGQVNGLDAGPIAVESTYAVHVIKDSSEYNATGALLSLSATAPQLPYGYDSFRLVGYVYIDASSNITLFYQLGSSNVRRFIFDAAMQTPIENEGSDTFVDFSFGNQLPFLGDGKRMLALLQATFTCSVSQHGAFFGELSSNYGFGQNYFIMPSEGEMSTQIEVIVTGSVDAMWMQWKTSNASDELTVTISGYELTV
jgi:hypothetical protein